MKRVLPFLILMFFSLLMQAQAHHFIFLQTEGEQPFFVKQQERSLSSGTSGFVLLSRLADSAQLIRIGFPGNKYAEQQFLVPFNGSDRGFVLRQNSSQSWVLQDLQGGAQLQAIISPGKVRMIPKQVSPFTATLAKASGDPTLLYDLVPVEPVKEVPAVAVSETETVKEQPASAAVANSGAPAAAVPSATAPASAPTAPAVTIDSADRIADSAAVALPSPIPIPSADSSRRSDSVTSGAAVAPADSVASVRPLVSADPVSGVVPVAPIADTSFKRSLVTRRSESSTTAGFGLTFLDQQGQQTDTIRILIPRDSTSVRLVRKEEQGTVVTPETRPGACEQVAGAAELTKLRRRMEKAKNDDGMLQEVVRFIRARCLNTEQIRDLGRLFPGDGGRIKLYRQVYPRTADPSAFPDLAAELHDDYFRGQFRDIMH